MIDNPYLQILFTLTRAKVRFVVAGGVAVVLHGVERVTMDIDIAVDMEEKNLQKFLGAVKDLGLLARAPVPGDFILDPRNRERIVREKNAVVFTYIDPKDSLKQLDVFLREELSYDVLVKSSVAVQLGEETVWIVSKKKLIELKQEVSPQRPKDLLDITELTRLLERGSVMTRQTNGDNDQVFKNLTSEDFSGKTRFTELSAEDKMRWLACAARFVQQARKAKGVKSD